MRHHFHDFRRGHRGSERHDVAAFNVRVAEHVGELNRIHGHHFFGPGEINAVARDKVVNQVELLNRFTVEFGHRAVDDADRRFGIVRTFHRDKALFNPLLNETILIHRAFRQCFKSFRSHESASRVLNVGGAIVFGSAPSVASTVLPISRAEITAWRTAPESPEITRMASLLKLVPWAGEL